MPSKAATVLTGLQKAQSLLSTEPQESKRIAVRLLDRAHETPELLGRILGVLGSARHHCGDRAGADSAYLSAIRAERSRLERGHILCRWSLLELDRCNPGVALQKACQGVELINSAKASKRDLAQGLLARGIVFRRIDQCDDAEADIRWALTLIHPKRDQDLHYRALHNLSIALLYGKRDPTGINHALKTLDEVKELLRKYRIPRRSFQGATILWVQGLAYKMAGAEERADDLLCKAQSIFFDMKAFNEWLQVSLDLIELYMHHHRWGRVKMLAREMVCYASDAETIAVLRIFHDAIKGERVELTKEILTAVYARIHGDARQVPMITTPQTIDELDVGPIGW